MRVLAIASLFAAAGASAQNANVDFAFGGAQTGRFNLVGALVPGISDAAAAQGIYFASVPSQLDMAEQVLNDVDGVKDLFWVYAGANDILGQLVLPPTPPTLTADNIGAAMERLYNQGARRFVIPNNYAVGRMPILATFPFPPEALPQVRAGLTGYTFGVNAALLNITATFRAAHPDCEVTDIDVFTIVETAIAQGVFTNTDSDCVTDNAATCAGYLFTDNVHMTSAGWALVAADVKSKITKPTRRIITIGDSYSDKGASMDVWLRSIGFAPNLPPKFFAGRFTDGPNVIDQVEALLPVQVVSTAVLIPFTTTVTAVKTTEVVQGLAQSPLKGESNVAGDYFVPKFVKAAGMNGDMFLTFDMMTCVYKFNANYAIANGPAYVFVRCLNSKKIGGDKVNVANQVVVTTLTNGLAPTAIFNVALMRYTCTSNCTGTIFATYTLPGIIAGVVSLLGLSAGIFMYRRQKRRNSMKIPKSTLTELATVNPPVTQTASV